jgi:hypothetical protein
MRRLLVLATTTGYQTRAFGDAAERLGVELAFATDRCDRIDDPWRDGAVPIRFYDEDAAVAAILDAHRSRPVDGLVVVGDRPTVIAARVAGHLKLPWHPPDAARVARDKRKTRERLRDAGLPVPWFESFDVLHHSPSADRRFAYPCVVKPTALSGSRGVMRANTAGELDAAVARLQALLASPDIRAERDAAHDTIVVEQFIPGQEFAVEAVLQRGALHVIAIFDKPDPLDGPFFEETIYVTPSRAALEVQRAIAEAIGGAARAIGLYHGPIHAECRVNADGVFVLEVAARPIGGLCARALHVEVPGRDGICRRAGVLGPLSGAGTNRESVIPYEDALMLHALGEDAAVWRREPASSAVMMIPIPKRGILRGVDGVDRARAVPNIEDVRITAKPDQVLVPLPEGASYLGFIFASAASPDTAERALRLAHAELTFTIDAQLPVLTVSQTRYNQRHG